MGCPTLVELDQSFTFSITTHDPDTGVLTDADSLPFYQIFEENVATPILSGVMPKLSDVNTTGCYIVKVAATGANGFVVGKTYTIYIEATVMGSTGGITYNTQCVSDPVIALLDLVDGIEPGMTPRETLRILLAAAAGILNGAATATVHIRDTNDTKDRITAVVDEHGNRIAVTLDKT